MRTMLSRSFSVANLPPGREAAPLAVFQNEKGKTKLEQRGGALRVRFHPAAQARKRQDALVTLVPVAGGTLPSLGEDESLAPHRNGRSDAFGTRPVDDFHKLVPDSVVCSSWMPEV